VAFIERGGGFQNAAPAAARILDYYFNQRYVAKQEAP